VIDRWNFWTFQVDLSGNFNGEKSQHWASLWGGISARRVTEDWKVSLSMNGDYNESQFDFGTSKVLSVARGQGFHASVIRSLSSHWSVGLFGSASASTFSNTRLNLVFYPALEYNIFPYEQSTRQQFRIQYNVRGEKFRYVEETIFDKTDEYLFSQSLSFTLDLQQPWGTVSTTLRGSHYLHDFDKKRLTLFSDLSLRIYEGLSLTLFGSFSRLNDQLSLRKGSATQEQVYLRRTQLATSYRFSGYVGISYTFGSIYNNIVNPRFGQ
jgi:hypothetical protein